MLWIENEDGEQFSTEANLKQLGMLWTYQIRYNKIEYNLLICLMSDQLYLILRILKIYIFKIKLRIIFFQFKDKFKDVPWINIKF